MGRGCDQQNSRLSRVVTRADNERGARNMAARQAKPGQIGRCGPLSLLDKGAPSPIQADLTRNPAEISQNGSCAPFYR
jgi:hypothetical protein